MMNFFGFFVFYFGLYCSHIIDIIQNTPTTVITMSLPLRSNPRGGFSFSTLNIDRLTPSPAPAHIYYLDAIIYILYIKKKPPPLALALAPTPALLSYNGVLSIARSALSTLLNVSCKMNAFFRCLVFVSASDVRP